MVTTVTPRRSTSDKVDRLNTASQRRVIEPEDRFVWRLSGRQVIADELLTVHGLDVSLTAEQRDRLAREETAAMLATGIRFESVLDAGFSLQIAKRRDLVDPRVTYMLHEIGEETRHARAFLRMIALLDPSATNPFDRGLPARVRDRVIGMVVRNPAFLLVMVLAGEEIPDLLQRIACEHPDTDPLLAEVARYHRQEEARHLGYARTVLPEHWRRASRRERWRIRYAAPRHIGMLFDAFVHPGVYETVGLPGWKTWRAVNRLPERIAIRHAAVRPIVATLVEAGCLRTGRIPRGWRRLAGVDRVGVAIPGDPPLPVIG